MKVSSVPYKGDWLASHHGRLTLEEGPLVPLE